MRESFERMPERELKALYLRCERESSQRLLPFEEAAGCSIAFEALKQRSFAGDFGALLEWWRRQRSAESGDARPSGR